jgi:hypothetical protein
LSSGWGILEVMSRKNPVQAENDFVLMFQAALSRKLGRPAAARKVKNYNEWWITDPVFSFIQRGMQKGVTGYRAGFHYNSETDELSFYLVHSRLMATFLKSNITTEILVQVIDQTWRFRDTNYLYWSSRVAKNQVDSQGIMTIQSLNLKLCKSQIRQFDKQHGLANDLFPIHRRKDGKKAIYEGNDFFVLLGENCITLSQQEIAELLDSSWQLFCCLYPTEPLERRAAALARSLRSAKISRECEYVTILGLPNARTIAKRCAGQIQGAHIKPHAFGGSDKAENGLWLCEHHHRATEGKLQGTRGKVQFIRQ